MGGAIVAAQSGAVHAEGDVEVLERDVVDDHVVGALHERRVDGQERTEPLDGQSAGEEGGVFLGDPDVVVFIGMFVGEMDQPGSGRHGAGDGANGGVGVGEAGQGFAENLGIGGRGGGIRLAGILVEAPQAVEFVGPLERRCVAFAFLGEDVQQDGLVLCFEELEGPNEQRGVVAVDGAVVAQAQLVENHAREDEIFNPLLHLFAQGAGHPPAHALDEFGRFFVQLEVGRVGRDLVEVMGDGADVFGDAPFVVVEDDDEPLGGIGDVVERLVVDAARERRVARHADNRLVGTALVASHSQPQAGGKGGPGMACAVDVVLTFGP